MRKGAGGKRPETGHVLVGVAGRVRGGIPEHTRRFGCFFFAQYLWRCGRLWYQSNVLRCMNRVGRRLRGVRKPGAFGAQDI
jgi:hypothetical protein